jgi:hypothetical protein
LTSAHRAYFGFAPFPHKRRFTNALAGTALSLAMAGIPVGHAIQLTTIQARRPCDIHRVWSTCIAKDFKRFQKIPKDSTDSKDSKIPKVRPTEPKTKINIFGSVPIKVTK